MILRTVRKDKKKTRLLLKPIGSLFETFKIIRDDGKINGMVIIQKT